MKNVFTGIAATLILATPLASSAFAGTTVAIPPTLSFPTDFDGYMSERAKKAAQTANTQVTKKR